MSKLADSDEKIINAVGKYIFKDMLLLEKSDTPVTELKDLMKQFSF